MAESTTITQNTEIPSINDSTPTLIASVYGRKVFGLDDTVPIDNYKEAFYYNILPFKVKEIISAGGNGEYICYWTIDDRLLFSGFLSERSNHYFNRHFFTKEQKQINNKLSDVFEFNWKDFIKNKLLEKVNLQSTTTRPFHTIKKVYALDGDCIIIELDNNILFYYYLNNDQYDVIPVNNVKWIKGGIMSDKVYIYTNLNELFTFKAGTLEKVNLHFLQKNTKSTKNSTQIRLAATTNCKIDMLVTEDNKIYIKSEPTTTYGVVNDSKNIFEYRETPFENVCKIIDIKGGFSHFIILLENKKVYSIGFNSLGQLGVNQSVIERTFDFNPIVLQTREDILVDKIFVSSRGTVLRTDTELIFLGEVIEGFKQSYMIPDVRYSHILKRQEGNNRKWNTVSCGSWNYLVYYKDEGNTKDMEYFLHNLKKACLYDLPKNLTHDIEINFN